MNIRDAQRKVREFHIATGSTVGFDVSLRDEHLRADLIVEEANETVAAIRQVDLIEAIDGLCDLIYVALGAAVAWGVEMEPFFNEVHRSNMTKVGGPVRADGKIMKHPDWSPPDIAGLLDQQVWAERDVSSEWMDLGVAG